MPTRTYRALTEGKTFDISLEGDHRLTLDDTPLECRFEKVSDDYFLLRVDERSIPVAIASASAGVVRVTIGNRSTEVQVKDETDLLLERFGLREGAGAAEQEVRAPMPGLVLRVAVEVGQSVEEGEGLLVLEAMKMENELQAPTSGTIVAVNASAGSPADKGEVLVEIETG